MSLSRIISGLRDAWIHMHERSLGDIGGGSGGTCRAKYRCLTNHSPELQHPAQIHLQAGIPNGMITFRPPST